jgi:hypothetical protein
MVALALCGALAWRLAGQSKSVLSERQEMALKTESHSPPAVSPSVPFRAPPSDTEAVPVAFAGVDTPEARIITDRPRFVQKTSTAQRNAGKGDLELQKVSRSLRDYRMAFHENPVGNNAEITQKLIGKNSRGMRYLSTDAHINDKGQLTDRWDRPVFFHQISKTTMEIRSAGPDHAMWTEDDEVLR